jgi:hypothetical protein
MKLGKVLGLFLALAVIVGLAVALLLTTFSGGDGPADSDPAGLTAPKLRVEPSVVSSDEVVSLHIMIPGDDEFDSKWTYGYTVLLQEPVGSKWKHRFTLYLGMEPSGTFSKPGYTKQRHPIVLSIGFGGDNIVRMKVPPVEPGRYRVLMDFGYDSEERKPAHIAVAEFEVE